METLLSDAVQKEESWKKDDVVNDPIRTLASTKTKTEKIQEKRNSRLLKDDESKQRHCFNVVPEHVLLSLLST